MAHVLLRHPSLGVLESELADAVDATNENMQMKFHIIESNAHTYATPVHTGTASSKSGSGSLPTVVADVVARRRPSVSDGGTMELYEYCTGVVYISDLQSKRMCGLACVRCSFSLTMPVQ